MTERIVLAGGSKCPICGQEFKIEPPLRPNLNREFYAGRVKFFKEVECRCRAKYDLCIEEKYDSKTCEHVKQIINLIVLQEGVPLEQIEKEEKEQRMAEAEAKAIEAVHQAIEEKGDLPTLKQRQEIKRQTILATIVDRGAKIDTLTHMTTNELRTMLKRRKIKFTVTESKLKLAEKLLEHDPSVVVANPND